MVLLIWLQERQLDRPIVALIIFVFGQPDPSMLLAHVSVDPLALRERLQTHPTNVSLALDAGNMVASLIPLDRNRTPRTVLHVVARDPLLEELVAVLLLRAREPVVRLRVAVRADAQETRRALYDGPLRPRAVDLDAVRRGTVVQLLRVGVHVRRHGRYDDRVEFVRLENAARGREGDGFCTLRLVAQTRQGEVTVIEGGEEILRKTRPTPLVTTPERYW